MARRSDYDRAVDRIVTKYRKLDSALTRSSDKHASDWRTARDATWDVLVLVVAGHLADKGQDETAAVRAARAQVAELIGTTESPAVLRGDR